MLEVILMYAPITGHQAAITGHQAACNQCFEKHQNHTCQASGLLSWLESTSSTSGSRSSGCRSADVEEICQRLVAADALPAPLPIGNSGTIPVASVDKDRSQPLCQPVCFHLICLLPHGLHACQKCELLPIGISGTLLIASWDTNWFQSSQGGPMFITCLLNIGLLPRTLPVASRHECCFQRSCESRCLQCFCH